LGGERSKIRNLAHGTAGRVREKREGRAGGEKGGGGQERRNPGRRGGDKMGKNGLKIRRKATAEKKRWWERGGIKGLSRNGPKFRRGGRNRGHLNKKKKRDSVAERRTSETH